MTVPETLNQFEIDRGNPLLRDIPERTMGEWLRDLKYDSRDAWPKPFGQVPESYTKQIEKLVIPTSNLVSIATSISSMLIASLRDRDPREQNNLRLIYKMAEYENMKFGAELEKMPWFKESAQGAILRGPTGCAKSHVFQAILRVLPQVSDHGEHTGWQSLQQVVYLRVYMPADSSRTGLLLGIAAELDSILGTNYSAELQRRKRIEHQLLYVLRILMIHRVGMLILEEAQERTLGSSVWAKEFCTIFLRMMNCGIPLVLVGNPLAFDHVLAFSQNLRRLTKNGLHEFIPYFNADVEDWRDKLAPGIWNWTVFDKADEFKATPEFLYKRTGGVPDFLATYRRECLVTALRLGGDCVTRQHADAAWGSPVMLPLHELIEAMSTKNIEVLSTMPDQPVAFLQKEWGKARKMLELQRAMEAMA